MGMSTTMSFSCGPCAVLFQATASSSRPETAASAAAPRTPRGTRFAMALFSGVPSFAMLGKVSSGKGGPSSIGGGYRFVTPSEIVCRNGY